MFIIKSKGLGYRDSSMRTSCSEEGLKIDNNIIRNSE